MLDPYQLPVLLKAIDFVFDEGRKILEERRERRKVNETPQNSEEQEPVQEIPAPAPQPEPEKEEEIKQDLLSSKIDEILWQNNQKEIEHLVRLLEKHTGNYYILKEQYAEFGSIMVPPHILSQMKEKENLILETKKRLEIILSKVYKKDINPVK